MNHPNYIKIKGRILGANNLKDFSYFFIRSNEKYFHVKKENLPEEERISRGDIVEAECSIPDDKEKYFKITSYKILGQHEGFLPNEEFIRNGNPSQNFVKATFNPQFFDLFKKKSTMITSIRNFLSENNFQEVSTPILLNSTNPSKLRELKVMYGNKTAFLRKIIEPKLRYFIATGFDKVYEIGSIFRDITSSKNFKNEFSNLDALTAYTNLDDAINLSLQLYSLSRSVFGMNTIDIERVKFAELLRKEEKELNPQEQHKIVRKRLNERNNPIIVQNYPSALNPIAKTNNNDKYALDFRICLQGKTLFHGYELENNLEQLRKKRVSYNKNLEDQINDDFEKVMQFGLPPCSGFGMGIERLVQHLSGREGIGDVYFFGGSL